jgi:hypothetical protein
MALSGCYFFWLKPSYYKMWGGFIFVLVMASRFSTTLELTRHFENLRVTGVGQAQDDNVNLQLIEKSIYGFS